MNKQEIFDAVVAHIHKQGQRAASSSYSGCFYSKKGSDLKCGVGALMNEEELEFASRSWEDYAIDDILNEEKELGLKIFRPFFRENENLLLKIQEAHDNVATNWRNEFDLQMISIATHFELNAQSVQSTPWSPVES